MAISEVEFGAFSLKHLYLADNTVSSSDVMTEAVARLTGRAALQVGIKKVTKSGVVKYSGLFSEAVVDENRATYRSGTTINGLIALTPKAIQQWYEAILVAANATTDVEFHIEHVLTESAGITLALTEKKNYGSDLEMSGGYSVKANVLFRKDALTASAVHLESMTFEGETLDSQSLKNQSARLSGAFLAGLAAS